MNTKCRQAIEKYNMLSKGDSIIIGLSGGADSASLLHWLCFVREEFDLSLKAVHINHMIRGEEANRDAQHAEKLCLSLGVDFQLYEIDIPSLARQKDIGLEECGREERYRIFSQESEKLHGKIATAHTLSDSIETVLFHIIRGCTVNGLRGIPPVRGNIIRPLILCERSDIEAYCSAHNIEYVTDSTNLTTDYTRNKIRLQILPLMQQINPSVGRAIARLAESAAEDDDFLNKMSDEVLDRCDLECKADELYQQDAPILRRSLVSMCSHHIGVTPEYRHIALMQSCIQNGGGAVELSTDKRIHFTPKSIRFSSNKQGAESDIDLSEWVVDFGFEKILLPNGHYINAQIIDRANYENISKFSENLFKNAIDYDKINFDPICRFRRAGDCFAQAGRANTKSLKKLFNESHIPVEQRNALPMVCSSENKIIWIYGIGVAEGFQITESTKRILHIQYE